MAIKDDPRADDRRVPVQAGTGVGQARGASPGRPQRLLREAGELCKGSCECSSIFALPMSARSPQEGVFGLVVVTGTGGCMVDSPSAVDSAAAESGLRSTVGRCQTAS